MDNKHAFRSLTTQPYCLAWLSRCEPLLSLNGMGSFTLQCVQLVFTTAGAAGSAVVTVLSLSLHTLDIFAFMAAICFIFFRSRHSLFRVHLLCAFYHLRKRPRWRFRPAATRGTIVDRTRTSQIYSKESKCTLNRKKYSS